MTNSKDGKMSDPIHMNRMDTSADYRDGYMYAGAEDNEIIATQSALLAQMAAALEGANDFILDHGDKKKAVEAALTAARTLSPDPQWQRVPEGYVVVPEHLSDGLLMQVGTMANYEPASDTADKDHRDWWTDVLHSINRARGEG